MGRALSKGIYWYELWTRLIKHNYDRSCRQKRKLNRKHVNFNTFNGINGQKIPALLTGIGRAQSQDFTGMSSWTQLKPNYDRSKRQKRKCNRKHVNFNTFGINVQKQSRLNGIGLSLFQDFTGMSYGPNTIMIGVNHNQRRGNVIELMSSSTLNTSNWQNNPY